MLYHKIAAHQQNDHKLLVDLFRSGQTKTLLKGSDLSAAEESDTPHIYFISHGYVEVSRSIDDEKLVQLIYGQGAVLPLLSLAGAEMQQNHLQYTTLCKTKLYMLPMRRAMDKISKDLRLANVMISKLLNFVAIAEDRVANLGNKRARDRVIHRLLTLSAQFGEKDGRGFRLDKNISNHKVIGQSINLSRETVSREFEKLRRDNLVISQDHITVIPDVWKLYEEIKQPINAYMRQLFEV